MQCRVLCHCFRWGWLQSECISRKAACTLGRCFWCFVSCLPSVNTHGVIVSDDPPFFIFQSSKPRLNCLVKVYKSCQEILSKCWWHTNHTLTMFLVMHFNVYLIKWCFQMTKSRKRVVFCFCFFHFGTSWFNVQCIFHDFLLFSPIWIHSCCKCNLLNKRALGYLFKPKEPNLLSDSVLKDRNYL